MCVCARRHVLCIAAVVGRGRLSIDWEIVVIMPALFPSSSCHRMYTVLGIAWLASLWPSSWGGWNDDAVLTVSIIISGTIATYSVAGIWAGLIVQ